MQLLDSQSFYHADENGEEKGGLSDKITFFNFHYCYFYTFSFIINPFLFFFLLNFCKFPSLKHNAFFKMEIRKKGRKNVKQCMNNERKCIKIIIMKA